MTSLGSGTAVKLSIESTGQVGPEAIISGGRRVRPMPKIWLPGATSGSTPIRISMAV